MVNSYEKIKTELVYSRENINVPSGLQERGWGEKYSVKIEKEGEKFVVGVDCKFKDGIDPLDKLPTSVVCDSYDEALVLAREAESDLEAWDSSHN